MAISSMWQGWPRCAISDLAPLSKSGFRARTQNTNGARSELWQVFKLVPEELQNKVPEALPKKGIDYPMAQESLGLGFGEKTQNH